MNEADLKIFAIRQLCQSKEFVLIHNDGISSGVTYSDGHEGPQFPKELWKDGETLVENIRLSLKNRSLPNGLQPF